MKANVAKFMPKDQQTMKVSSTHERRKPVYLTPQNEMRMLAYLKDLKDAGDKQSMNKTINEALDNFFIGRKSQPTFISK